MTSLLPRDSVPCPKFAGNPHLPAESCVIRSLKRRNGLATHIPVYPICADCPLGRLRRQHLEAGGWTWDPLAFRKRSGEWSRAGYRGRARHLATSGAHPASSTE